MTQIQTTIHYYLLLITVIVTVTLYIVINNELISKKTIFGHSTEIRTSFTYIDTDPEGQYSQYATVLAFL